MTLNANDEARIEIITGFLSAIFEGTQEPIFFQTLANDAGDVDEAPNKKSILTREVPSVGRFVLRHDRNRRGTFFCVATIAKGSSTRNKDNCSEITTAHIDIDFRSIAEDEPAIRKVVDTLPVPPSIIVFSGGGLHLYWLLKEPLDAQLYRDRIEALNRKLALILAGDIAATDVCRLMRLPGTVNSKHGDQRQVTVEKLEADRRYDFDELEEALSELAPKLTVRTGGPGSNIKPERQLNRGSAQEQFKTPLPAEEGSNPFLKVAAEQGWKPPLDVGQALASMVYPGNVHDTQIRVAASLAKSGVGREETVALVLEATMNAPGVDVRKWDRRAEEKKIGGAYDSAVAKFDIPAERYREVPSELPPSELPPSELPPSELPSSADTREDTREDTRANAQNAKNAKNAQTPKTTDSVTGKGAPIGVGLENVVQFAQKGSAKLRKTAQNSAQATHIVLARTVLEVLENDGYRLMFTETGPYAYEDGLWVLRDEKDLASWLNAALEEGAQGLGLESKLRLINEARAWIVRQPRLQGRGALFDRHGKVPTLSGLVDPVTGECNPSTAGHYCTWRIPYAYDPAAQCPHWLQLLADVFSDRPAEVAQSYTELVQDWMGMGLIDRRAKALARALALIGGSNSGKSTLLDVIGALYGSAVISVPIDELENSHGTTPFMQRLAWVLPEAFDASKWHVPSKVKALISGEPVQINVKGGRIFSHAYTGPVAWGANADPQFKEATRAITNRLLLVQCKREFDEDNPVGVAVAARDVGLSSPSELVVGTEMPGVLAWALEGLRRAKARGYFLIPAEGRSALETIQRDSNIARGFVDDCIDFDPDSMIGTADFTAAFASWWGVEKGGRNTPGAESIGRALKALAEPRIAIDRRELRANVVRYYAGVKFNETGMKHWLDALNREAFNYEGFKGGMSTQDEGPNRDIPAEWSRKPVVLAMRVAHAKSVTVPSDRFPGDVPLKKTVTEKSGHRSPTGHENGHDEKGEPPQEDIPF